MNRSNSQSKRFSHSASNSRSPHRPSKRFLANRRSRSRSRNRRDRQLDSGGHSRFRHSGRFRSRHRPRKPSLSNRRSRSTLLGETITWQACIHGVLIRELSIRTVIVNSYKSDNESAFIPCISLLTLRTWTKKHNPKPNHASLTREDIDALTNLKLRLDLLIQLGNDLNPIKFEEFHLVFEQLRCWAWGELNKEKERTLRSWFTEGEFVRGDSSARITIPDVSGMQRNYCNSLKP